MSARILGRWVITHWRAADNSAGRILVRGRDALDTLQRYGIFPKWNAKARGWAISDEFLHDVCAIASLEVLGYRVVDVGGTNCEHADVRAERREVRVDPSCHCDDLGPVPAELAAILGAEELHHTHRAAA